MKPPHRLRIGLIGLASVFLLVMLATVFVHVAGGDQLDENSIAAENAAAPSDPLADLGVAPGNPDQAEKTVTTDPVKKKPQPASR